MRYNKWFKCLSVIFIVLSILCLKTYKVSANTASASQTNASNSFADSVWYDDGTWCGTLYKNGGSYVSSGSDTSPRTFNWTSSWVNRDYGRYKGGNPALNNSWSWLTTWGAPGNVDYLGTGGRIYIYGTINNMNLDRSRPCSTSTYYADLGIDDSFRGSLPQKSYTSTYSGLTYLNNWGSGLVVGNYYYYNQYTESSTYSGTISKPDTRQYTQGYSGATVLDRDAIVTSNAPTKVLAGSAVSYTVTATNNGAYTWVAGQYKLGTDWGASNYPSAPARYELPYNIAPGGSYTWTINYTASTSAVTYMNSFKMLQESVAWFGANPQTITQVVIPPTISAVIKNISSNGYDVFCTVGTGTLAIDRVQVPTWTNLNGQDDIDVAWQTSAVSKATFNGGNTWVYHVNRKVHNNEYGVYLSHAYVFDSGGFSAAVATTCTLARKSLTAPNTWEDVTEWTGTTIKAYVEPPVDILTVNRFENGDFVNGTTDWAASADATTITNVATPYGTGVNVAREDGDGGNWPLNYIGPVNQDTYLAGHTYTFSFYYRMTRGSGTPFYIGWWINDAGGYRNTLPIITTDMGDGWKYATASYTFTSNQSANIASFMNSQSDYTTVQFARIGLVDTTNSMVYKVGVGGTYKTYNGAVTISSNCDVYFKYTDVEGYISPESVLHVTNIDKTPPTGDSTYSMSYDLQLSAMINNVSDNGGSGVKELYAVITQPGTANSVTKPLHSVDASTWQLDSLDAYSLFSSEQLQVDIYAKDNVGNTALLQSKIFELLTANLGITPVISRQGQLLTFTLDTTGQPYLLELDFPQEIYSLDPAIPTGKVLIPIVESNYLQTKYEYYLPLTTPLTLDTNSNRLNTQYQFTAKAYKRNGKETSAPAVGIDVSGNIFKGIRTRMR